MAKTPYNSLSSEDILSAHVSGLQTDINKIQSALNMQTSTRSGHSLEPVIDQEDPSVRYRIYEATERNWLENPAPIIYRNGVSVNSEEYTLQAPYGVVVFHEQQDSNSQITVDFTHINESSGKILEIEGRLDSLDDGDETPQPTVDFIGGPIYLPGSYFSHQKKNYDLHTRASDGSYNTEPFDMPIYSGEAPTSVNAESIDAFPLIVTQRMNFTQFAIRAGVTNPYAVRIRMGVYADDNRRPGELIIGTPDIIVSPGDWARHNIDLTLDPGLYWIARQDKSPVAWYGLDNSSVELLHTIDAELLQQGVAGNVGEVVEGFGGYRALNVTWTDNGSMPSTFPASGSLFARSSYATPWLVVG